MCKRGEDLARRSTNFDGGTKSSGSRAEEVKIDGIAGEHPNLLAVWQKEIYGPLTEDPPAASSDPGAGEDTSSLSNIYSID
jgi:hypothetical protein